MPIYSPPTYWSWNFMRPDNTLTGYVPVSITVDQFRAAIASYEPDVDYVINQLNGFNSIGWVRTPFSFYWIKGLNDPWVPPIVPPNSLAYPTEITLNFSGAGAPLGGSLLLDFSVAADSGYVALSV